MRDEEQLATLVHLLAVDAPEVKLALQQDDCKLLCFIGRLINSYSSRDGSDESSAKFALLRLAVRVALMRYASYVSNPDCAQDDQFNERMFEWEKCLLKSLYNLQSSKQGVDAEMAWTIVGLLVRWSIQMKHQRHAKIDALVEDLWIKSIEVLLSHHQSNASNQSGVVAEPLSDKTKGESDPDNPELLMAKTITSLLDGSDESTMNNQEWTTHFDTAVASCFRSYLETISNPVVTKTILLGFMQWANQKDTISPTMYEMILHYLSICLQRALGGQKMDRKHVSYQQQTDESQTHFVSDKNNKSSSGEIFAAIKSFLFYGLIVLCNEANTDAGDTSTSTPVKVKINRGEIYATFLGLWQLLGPEWLYENASTASDARASASNTTDWWQRSDFTNKGDSNNRLGQTWKLCTLIRLAAGEFRLSMGRWMACVEEKRSNESSLVPEIVSCAQLVVQAVQLMTNLADDDDEDMMEDVVWTPDAILHMRQSLQDAMNAAIQYFNENDFSSIMNCRLSSSNELKSEWEEIGRTCCLILGTIAPEELDQLLNNDDGEDSDSPSFTNALCTCVLFCGSTKHESYHQSAQLKNDEPISCLLPCIMSIIDIACSGDEESIITKTFAERVVKTLCSKGDLIEIITDLLNRLYARVLSSNDKSDQCASIMSLANLVAIIGAGLLEINKDSSSRLQIAFSENDKLSEAVMKWNELFTHSHT